MYSMRNKEELEKIVLYALPFVFKHPDNSGTPVMVDLEKRTLEILNTSRSVEKLSHLFNDMAIYEGGLAETGYSSILAAFGDVLDGLGIFKDGRGAWDSYEEEQVEGLLIELAPLVNDPVLLILDSNRDILFDEAVLLAETLDKKESSNG